MRAGQGRESTTPALSESSFEEEGIMFMGTGTIVNCPRCRHSEILGCIYHPHYPEHCSVCGHRLREQMLGEWPPQF
jgi:hypothetical protein